MKINLKNNMSFADFSEMFRDEYEENRSTVYLDIEQVRYFLENYDSLSKNDYYKMICNFYDVNLEHSDYIDYVNFKTNNNFNKVIKMYTDVILKDTMSEGHGRDFSWWTVSFRMYLECLVNCELGNVDKYYKLDEIKELIKENKIYPLDYFYEKCDDRLYANGGKNDIDYLVKTKDRKKIGQLSVNDEYYEYFVDKVLDEVSIREMFLCVRNFIVSCRNYLECYLIEYYFSENRETKKNLSEVNNLITLFNKKIKNINIGQDEKIKSISKNNIKMVMEYLKSLYEKKEYKDITLMQVISIIESLDYEKNKDLCNDIEKIIIELGDSSLCYDMICSVNWINFDKMLKVIIDSGDEWIAYDMITELNRIDDTSKRKLVQLVIDSKSGELNYKLAISKLSCIDIPGHARAVIDSGSARYNYLFASNVPGADVRAHGEVVMKYGNAYENSQFIIYVRGADVEKHREVIRLKKEEEENKNSLKKTLKK